MGVVTKFFGFKWSLYLFTFNRLWLGLKPANVAYWEIFNYSFADYELNFFTNLSISVVCHLCNMIPSLLANLCPSQFNELLPFQSYDFNDLHTQYHFLNFIESTYIHSVGGDSLSLLIPIMHCMDVKRRRIRKQISRNQNQRTFILYHWSN